MSEKTPETIIEKIAEYSAGLEAVSRKRRRDFHKYPETAWLDENLGYYCRDIDRIGV